MHREEHGGSERSAGEEEDGPAHAADPLLEPRRDQDEPEEVQEDVGLRCVHEFERDPGPRRGPDAGSEPQPEVPEDGRGEDERPAGGRDLERVHGEDRDAVDEGDQRPPREGVRRREDDDPDRGEGGRLHVNRDGGTRLNGCGRHTNLSRIRAIFSAAWPSSTVSIHSVSSRSVTHGTPKKYASFWTPPESVRTFDAPISSAMKSR